MKSGTIVPHLYTTWLCVWRGCTLLSCRGGGGGTRHPGVHYSVFFGGGHPVILFLTPIQESSDYQRAIFFYHLSNSTKGKIH